MKKVILMVITMLGLVINANAQKEYLQRKLTERILLDGFFDSSDKFYLVKGEQDENTGILKEAEVEGYNSQLNCKINVESGANGNIVSITYSFSNITSLELYKRTLNYFVRRNCGSTANINGIPYVDKRFTLIQTSTRNDQFAVSGSCQLNSYGMLTKISPASLSFFWNSIARGY